MRLWRLIVNLAVVILSVPLFAQQPSADVQTSKLRQLYESYAKKYRFYDDPRPIIVPQTFSVQWENAYTAEKEQQHFCETPIESPRGLYALRYNSKVPYEVRVSQRLVLIEYLDQVRDGRPLFVPYIRSVIPDRDCAAYDIDTLYRHLSTADFSGIVCYSDLGGRLITVGRFVKGKIRAHEFIATRKSSAAKSVNAANEIIGRTTLYSYSNTNSATHNTPKELNGRLVYSGDHSATKVIYDLERCPICCEYIADKHSGGDHLLLNILSSDIMSYGSVISRKVADGTLILGTQPTTNNYNKEFITPAELHDAKIRRVSLDSLCNASPDRPVRPMFDSIMARYCGNVYFIKRAKRSPTQKDTTYLIEPLTHYTLVRADATFGTPITADALMAKIERGRCFVLDSRKANYFRPYYRFLSKDRVAIHSVYSCYDMFHQSVDRSLSDSTYIVNGNYINDAYIVPRATFDLNDPRVVDLDRFSSENDYIAINALLDPRGRWMERYNAARYVYKGSGDDPVYLIDRAEMTDSTIVVRQVQIIKHGGVDDRRTKNNPRAGIIFDE